MDSIEIDNVKIEKANAMKRYQRIQKIANFFRFFEICLALILFSWFSTRLPSVFRIFEKYFRQLCVVLISPWFVFLLGNVIVLTLFAKSGKFSDQDSVSDNAETDLYEEFVKKSEKNRMEAASSLSIPEEIVYEDKRTVYEEKNTEVSDTYPAVVMDTVKVEQTVKVEPVVVPVKILGRSQSVNSKREVIGKSRRELRRSETEIRRKSDVSGEGGQVQVEGGGASYSEAFMSNEEFQRTIEAFIAKQVRFHQEESKAIVLQ